MVWPALLVVVKVVPLVPEVELPPPVVEFEPPAVELLPPAPPTGTVEFEPAPPAVELPEDGVPVEPAPVTPSVVVVLASVATTTVFVPDAEDAVTVTVEVPEALAATVMMSTGGLPVSANLRPPTPAELAAGVDDLLGRFRWARLHGAVANAIGEILLLAQAGIVGAGTSTQALCQHAIDTEHLWHGSVGVRGCICHWILRRMGEAFVGRRELGPDLGRG